MLKHLLGLALAMACFAANAQTWTPLNGPVGGSVTCIDTFGGYLWAGTVEGGMYKSANNGATWQQGGYTGGVTCMVSNQGKLFIGTAGGGVYVTSNLGAQWTHCTTPALGGLMVSMTKQNNYLFCNQYGAMMRSADNGATWQFAMTGLPSLNTFGLMAVVSVGGVLLTEVQTQPGAAFYRSTDNGNTWVATNAASAGLIGSNGVTTFCSVGNRAFAHRQGSGLPVYYTDDAGLSWNPINANGTPPGILDISMSGGLYLAATTTGVMTYPVSQPANQGWAYDIGSLSIPLPITQKLYKNNTGLYIGCYGLGMLKADTMANNFQFINNGLVAGTVGFIDGKNNRLLAKISHQTDIWTSVTGGTSWEQDSITNYNFDDISASAKKGNLWYITVPNLGVQYSTDGGQHWKVINTGMGSTQPKSAFTTAAGQVLVGAASTIYKCVSDTSWTPLYSFSAGEEVYHIAEQGQYLFAGTQRYNTGPGNSGHLYRSGDGGQSWQVVSSGWPVYVDDVVGLTVQGNRIIAGTQAYGTWVSTNGGNTWDTLNTGLQAPVAGHITFTDLKTFNNIVYGVLQYDERLYTLSADSNHWTWINQQAIAPRALNVYATDSVLYVGTTNNGVWKKSLITTGNGVTEVKNRKLALRVYPNPSSSTTTIEAAHEMKLPATLQIVDATGKVCKTIQVSTMPYKLNEPQLAPGLYYLIVEDMEGNAGLLKWEKGR